MKRMPILFAATLMATLVAGHALAHEGHEHADEAVATATAADAAAPRLSLSQPPVELVAVREQDALVIWLDDYDSNAPLAGATLQVREGSRLLQAQPAADGSYRLPSDLFDEAQALSLAFIVQRAQGEQQLQGVLPAVVAATPASSRWWWLAAALAAILIAVSAWLLAVRLRRRPRL